MRNALDDQMEEMHGLFVAHFQKNKRMLEAQDMTTENFVGFGSGNPKNQSQSSKKDGEK